MTTEQVQGLVETVVEAVEDIKVLVPSIRRMTYQPELSRSEPSLHDVQRFKATAQRVLDNVQMLENALRSG